MKYLILLCISVLTLSASAQNYPFANDFSIGSILLNDGTQKLGYIKWFPAQEEKLIFREDADGEKKKYKPEELHGFIVDTLKFISLSNFDVYAADYAFLGNTSHVKHSFGQLIDSGSFTIYLVLFRSYDALSGTIESYPNFLFERKTDSGFQYAAFPYDIRMTDKKYERAKENLFIFFRDYPEITERIKLYKRQDSFLDIIMSMKKIN